MTASTVHDVTDLSESVYARACRLIETGLGGRPIPVTAEPDDHPTTGAHLARRVGAENPAVADHA